MLSSRQWAEWQVYYGLEPFGGERGDIQAAVVAQTMANIHRDPQRKPAGFTLTDFMPFADKPQVDTQTLSERIKAAMKGVNHGN